MIAGGRACGVAPFAPGKRGHAAEQALGRPPDEPDRSRRARSNKRRRSGAGGPAPACGARERLRARRLRRRRSRRASGQSPQRGLRGRQIGRAEVHHRLDEIAGPVGRHHRQQRVARSPPRDGCSSAVQPGDHALDVGVDRRRLLAERDRGDRRRRIGADARAAGEARRRLSGKPPRRTTSRAQAIRLRARA